MATFDYGNYGKFEKKVDQSQYRQFQRSEAPVPEEVKEPLLSFKPKQAEGSSLDVMGNYALGGLGFGKKADVSAMGLSANDQALVARYVTPEQQARIEAGMLAYFG